MSLSLSDLMNFYSLIRSLFTHGLEWILIVSTLVLFLYGIVLKRLPAFLVTPICIVMIFMAGQMRGYTSGIEFSENLNRIANEKLKQENTTKLVQLIDKLNTVSIELSTAMATQKQQADQTDQALSDIFLQFDKDNKDKKYVYTNDDGSKCLGAHVPPSIVRLLKQQEN